VQPGGVSSAPDVSEVLDFSKHVNSYLNESVRSADAKANILLAVAFAFVAVLSNDFGSHRSSYSASPKLLLFVSALVGFLWAASCTIAALWPRLTKPARGYIFWENLAAWPDSDTLVSGLVLLSPSDLLSEFAKQNHTISRIATRKYRLLRLAFPGLIVGLLVGLMGLLS